MRLTRFAKFAWSVLAYNLAVILWGAYVRASGSGAGCGSHWPLCNGEIIPRSSGIETIIEYSHRLTSGLALILVVILFVWALVTFNAKHSTRIGGFLSLAFIITEALIGAGLVLFEYVAENKSMARALWMSAHLINTFLLVAALSLTAWSATLGERLRIREHGAINWLFVIALTATLILGVSGAVTALGGTLFPVNSLAEGLKQDLSPTAHILIRLRFFHPIIAIFVSLLLIVLPRLTRAWQRNALTGKIAKSLIALILLQLVAGILNLILHAPIWLQLVHLLLSDLIWISLVLFILTTLAQPAHESSYPSPIKILFGEKEA
ncbi:MAG: COX15/CtaA family protein [Acidobacteria bacterium]|nr:COX15/CtaA family protein [Acidobacteriota bacterium]